MLLVQGTGEMTVLPAVNAIVFYHSAMDNINGSRVVNPWYWGNGVFAYSY